MTIRVLQAHRSCLIPRPGLLLISDFIINTKISIDLYFDSRLLQTTFLYHNFPINTNIFTNKNKCTLLSTGSKAWAVVTDLGFYVFFERMKTFFDIGTILK